MQKVEIIRGALPYIRRFKRKIFVIKFGGEVIGDEEAIEALAEDLSLINHVGIDIVIVHGGGTQADKLLEKMNIKPKFVNGRRITDKIALEVAEMVYRGKLNLEITAFLQKHGLRAVGLSGVDGNIINAKKREPQSMKIGKKIKKVDFGYVGDIVSVNTRFISLLLSNNCVPVISPLGSDRNGNIYNINADTIAAELASKMNAEKLIIMTDVPGVLRDVKDKTSVIPYMDVSQVKKMIKSGAIKHGMLPKIEASIYAIKNNVPKVHIVDGLRKHTLLLEVFTNEGSGTMIVKKTA